ncbi:YesL family protein [Aquibacillus rhizosphaerae]|uniref:YesL family protein n=1 Tax=Aquibacillus rhizosphaerae TaxID=3051431 RepID=A0ABT7L531_9BACI|nr:YesL family protein [Aquibacillus sp. LR5S19]MDL4840305.1 YesL family protein [Aquibacillus sp. LR5S19]
MSQVSLGPLFTIAERISKFAYVNLLWIVFTLAGIILFGFFPATIALFTVIRKWVLNDYDVPVFKTFWNSYKQEFLKGNLVGLIIAMIGVIFYVNLSYMQVNKDTLLMLTHIPLYLVMFAISLTLLYLIPVYVHYNVPFIQMFKNAFLIMFINPLNNLLLIISITITLYGMSFIPGVLFFFAGSVTAYIIMTSCYQAFKKVDEQKRRRLARPRQA